MGILFGGYSFLFVLCAIHPFVLVFCGPPVASLALTAGAWPSVGWRCVGNLWDCTAGPGLNSDPGTDVQGFWGVLGVLVFRDDGGVLVVLGGGADSPPRP